MLKPALARGKLHSISATTLDEYRKHIEKDAASNTPLPGAACCFLDHFSACSAGGAEDQAITGPPAGAGTSSVTLASPESSTFTTPADVILCWPAPDRDDDASFVCRFERVHDLRPIAYASGMSSPLRLPGLTVELSGSDERHRSVRCPRASDRQRVPGRDTESRLFLRVRRSRRCWDDSARRAFAPHVEPRQSVRLTRKRVRQDLDRNVAFKLRVARAYTTPMPPTPSNRWRT